MTKKQPTQPKRTATHAQLVKRLAEDMCRLRESRPDGLVPFVRELQRD